MKRTQSWKRLSPLTVSFWLAAVMLIFSADATHSRTQVDQSLTPEFTSSSNPSMLQLAQSFPNNCAEVIALSGLYVRREPTVYSEAIGILNYNTNVIAEAGGTEEWLPISAPLRGYVWRDWVAPCYVPPEVPPVAPE